MFSSATDKEFAKALKDTNSPFRLYLRRTDSVGYYKLLAQCREFLKKSHTDTRMSQDIAVMVLLLEKQVEWTNDNAIDWHTIISSVLFSRILALTTKYRKHAMVQWIQSIRPRPKESET